MWTVKTTDVFDRWFDAQDDGAQEKVLAGLLALAQGGPSVGRPLVDTIKGSRFTNLKELRVQHLGEPLRAFFVFDPLRHAIVLCAGNKGGNDKRFYKEMLPIAEAEYAKHLTELEIR
ncbi:type II toxin-antitoxin system RelE/ParE family toxin [Aeromonas cavernicola]|uniref:Addiction module toxin RelE n=1 Tax=Aeromonas cavernicola TaxID=1006623 RepID=A0A2H9U4E4_9GAMM|nr:type II toxin-antitoxin system RelE/ParE family toxin [Aeromonas cavernicola]PJG58913.1 addiction module toxin RelE [Aeromonas cavernicola]